MTTIRRRIRAGSTTTGWMVLAVLAASVVGRAPTTLPGTMEISGSSRLVEIAPLPPTDSAMCPYEPTGAVGVLMAAWSRQAASPDSASGAAKAVDFSQRKPVRMIRDPYSAYSAVAVDPVNNEVVMTDENLFNILVYDRTAATPATAKMTEPKRVIGGLNTRIEFQCGVYVDPASGDIYAVNNDTVNELVIFDRQAKGNTRPTRSLNTPHRTFGIAVDEGAQEMYLTIQHDDAVVVYRKSAEKDDTPIRLLQGNKTLMHDPHGIAIDTKNGLMFVANYGSTNDKVSPASESGAARSSEQKPNWPLTDEVPGSGKFFPPSITVYSLHAAGEVAPLRVIEGPATQLDWPSHLSYDAERQELYVANDMGDSILVFPATANGNAAPARSLKGPKTMIKNPTGVFVDAKNNELWVANFGNHSATVFPRGAAGDVAPLRMIRSGPLNEASLGIGNPHPVGYDSKRDQILVPN
jgi:DNA-binding beta-propeller fold protein YncE